MRKIQNADLHRLSVDDFKNAQKKPVIILLDSVRSMNNTGSVFRTADAFRCEAIGLCGITAIPPHRDIHKTALGAEDTVEWFYEKDICDAIRKYKSQDYIIAAIEQVEGGILLHDFKLKEHGKYVMIFGNEITGVSDEAIKLCDVCIEIPQHGTKHSLNVAVTAGIVCWEICKPFRL